MNYIDLITAIGAFLGGGWITALYKAKPEKTSIELENMSKTMDEMNKVIEVIKENNRAYKDATDATIKELEGKVDDLTRKVDMKNKAIYSAYDCEYPEKASDCIVLRTFRECHDCVKSRVEELNNTENESERDSD